MKLGFPCIRDITLGAVSVEQAENGIVFHRFSNRQEEIYKCKSSDFYTKALSSSGVKLRFRTDSENLSMKVKIARGSSRKYFSFDLFVNGEMKESFNNFSGAIFSGNYTKIQLPLGEFSFGASLGKGEKEICIYFPWSVRVLLKEFTLDDGAFVTPVKYRHKLLAFGDSITQGYDALYPSNKYITRLSELLCAEEINRAIGAELFFPELVAEGEEIEPRFITVAYGTNDWFFGTMEEFQNNCKAFFENLSKSYPTSKIIALTPIWRSDMNDTDRAGDFSKIGEYIKAVASGLPNLYCVDCFDFVPRDESLFADLSLHPNDRGFDCYFESLARRVQNILELE